MIKAIDILKAARIKISSPHDWGKGMRNYDRPMETFCAAEAIEAVCLYDDERRRAICALYSAAGLEYRAPYLTRWNDAPERTHAEVLAAFDLAIATLGLGDPLSPHKGGGAA